MTETRLPAAWLRPLLGMFAIAGVLALSACGGGSGAPNNPYAPGPITPGPLTVLPPDATIYSGVPTTLTVSGGVAPYFVYSSNTAVLPVTQAVAGNSVLLLASNVGAATQVVITAQDNAGTTAISTVTVTPAPLLPNLITITSNGDCSVATGLCSGGTGTASVVVTAPGGGGIPNRAVRFDVVSGAFAIQSLNPSGPLVSTLTVVTDQNGSAAVGIAVNANAPTQIATIRATDITTGNQVTGNFLIQQVTDGSQILSVIPSGTVTIDGPDANTCSSGVSVQYYIFGGTPPYKVAATFPGAVVLSGVPVQTNGGGFTATTTGQCFANMQFAISDATGRTIPGASGPLLTNEVGKASAAPPPSALAISPAVASASACAGKTFQFVIVGGTPPYSASVAVNPALPPGDPTLSPSPVPTSGGILSVTFLAAPPVPAATTALVTVTDTSSPKKSASSTITCN
jgi:hypothetical protein